MDKKKKKKEQTKTKPKRKKKKKKKVHTPEDRLLIHLDSRTPFSFGFIVRE